MQRKQLQMDSQTKSSLVADTIAALKNIPTKEELVKLLQDEVCIVTFDKINGDERTMSCTLIKELIPVANKSDALSETKIRNLEEKTVVVWDVNANGWRSFRYDRLKKVVVYTDQAPK